MLRFADHRRRPLPKRTAIDKVWNASGGHPVVAPTGSLRDLLLENSYGALTFDSTVVGWVDLPETERYYAGNTSGLGGPIVEAITSALDAIDPAIDFREFDGDGDGFVDAIAFVHSGYGAEWGGVDAYGTDYTNRIWSHSWSIPTWMSLEGVRVSSYQISTALWGTSGKEPTHVGVVAHETGHMLGLPDLYDTDGGSAGVGVYGLMGDSWGVTGDQLNPPHLSAWSKVALGWITPTRADTPGTYALPQVEATPAVVRIDTGFPSGEYLLIENREPTGTERTLPQGGLAIWHVDEAKPDNNSEGYLGQPGWPENGRHYEVALLQADGRYDLERGVNHGDATDLYHAGGVSTVDPTTVPDTNAYQGGLVIDTGNHISLVSAAGPVMTFRLSNDCTFTISSSGRSFSAAGGDGTVAVSATRDCGWTATSNAAWLTIVTGARGSGNGTVTFSVAVNTTGSVRQGTLTVAGQSFTVTQAAEMSFLQLTNGTRLDDALDGPAPQAAWKFYYVDVPAGTARFDVVLDDLTADGDLLVRFGSLPTASDYDCRPDLPSTAREVCTFSSPAAGRWWIGVTNHEAGAVAFTLLATYAASFVLPTPTGLKPGGSGQSTAEVVSANPIVLSWNPSVGASSYEVIAYALNASGDTWDQLPTASTTAPEVTYPLPIENTYYAWTVHGLGDGTSSPLAPLAYLYYRPAACRFAISPTNVSFNRHGGTGDVDVTTAAECDWTAVSDAPWITVESGGAGEGNGRVDYRVAGNTTGESRVGTITIAGKTFTVMQR
jgi:M6 family metalloprotease-like protein